MTKKRTAIRRVAFYVLMMVMACALLLIVKTDKVHAASKGTYYYVGSFNPTGQYQTGAIKKAYLKGSKLVVKGSLLRYTPKNYKTYSNSEYLKSKTRKFKLTKNTKYKTGSGYSGWQNVSKSYFNKWIKGLSKSQNGLGFIIKVKNGKVVWMKTSP